MRRAAFAFAVGLTLAVIPGLPPGPSPAWADAGRLTVSEIFASGASGRHPSQLAWSPDGSRLAYVWDDGEGEALWSLDAKTGERRLLLRLAELADPAENGEEPPEVEDPIWSPRGDALLFASGGDLHLLAAPGDGGGGKPRRLTRTEEEEKIPAFSPDGSRIAFIRDFDLHLLDLATGRERALTTDGEENQILNGINDWVYWEEVWDRTDAGFWWSPDGRRIAYYRFDESPVGVYPLVDSTAIPLPEVTWQKYPKAGTANPEVRVGVLDLATGKTAWMETGGGDAYLARVDWAPAGEAVAIQRLNRDQTRLDLLRCDPAAGACAPLHTETHPTWVNLGWDFRFLEDGRFLWGTERDGRRRLWLHAADGRPLRAVTPERWAVTSLDAVDEAAGTTLVTGFPTDTPLGPAGRQVARAGLEVQSWEVLTPEPGTHAADAAPAGGAWVHTWSTADTPPASELRRAGAGALPLPSAPPEIDPQSLPKWQLFTLPGPDGSRLPARLLKPEGFDPSVRYPAIMYHYGGPGSQVVVDAWNERGLWHKLMAQRGFVVLSVDNQASLFFGKPGEDRAHRRFGPVNLAAQLAGVEHLAGLGWVDPGRIGLWGWSGGGMHTLYDLLNRPGVWKAGVAGAPVTDWRLYDTIWTERYLDRPEENEEGYRLSSPLTFAGQLADRLLIVHGTADDNVHPQNTLVMSEALVEAGLPFEQAIYPGQKHGIAGASKRHFYEKMTEFFERELQSVAVEDMEVVRRP